MHSWMHETKDAQNCSIDNSTKHITAFVACAEEECKTGEDALGTVQFVSIPTPSLVFKINKQISKEGCERVSLTQWQRHLEGDEYKLMIQNYIFRILQHQ